MVQHRASDALLLGAESAQVRQAIRQHHRLLVHIALLHGDDRHVCQVLLPAHHSSRASLSHIQARTALQGPTNPRAHSQGLAQRAHAPHVLSNHRCRSFLIYRLLY